MEVKKLLGTQIKAFRKAKGMTQEKLAEFVGIEVTSMSALETGKSFPSPENLVKIANALDVKLEDLFSFDSLRTTEECYEDIIKNLEFIKNDKKKVWLASKFIKSIMQMT